MTEELHTEVREPWGEAEASPQPATAGGEEGEDLASPAPDPLAEAEAQRDEYLADLQRLAADFDNYRKRVARDQAQLVALAHEGLVKELLPVLDDLERALGAAEVHDEATVVEGVRLVQRALADQLAR